MLNNVNAKADSLTALLYGQRPRPWPTCSARTASRSICRPAGRAPIEIGGLKTADPLTRPCRAWWQAKADEIYKLIPDFGGFLVKANSEGQPGPQDYGRTHVDGANMLADARGAARRHRDVARLRLFARDSPDDRAKQALQRVQAVGRPVRATTSWSRSRTARIDFQPREPFHPLFGAMPQDAAWCMEFQITKEYLGFATHLVYLGPLFEEALKSDTYAQGRGLDRGQVMDGELDNRPRP